MGRILSTRVVGNTDIVVPSLTLKGGNAAIFNGLLVNVLDSSSTASAVFTVYDELHPGEPVEGTFNGTANTFASTEASFFRRFNIKVGDQLLFSDTTSNNGTLTITAIDAAYTTLTFASITGNASEPATIQVLKPVATFTYNFATDYSKNDATEAWNYTNGIFCRDGLTIKSTSWTNLEAYVLHS
jgi:hypothetical protein